MANATGVLESNSPDPVAQSIRFPTWLEFVDANFFWPSIVQILVTIAFNALSVCYAHWYNKRGWFYGKIHAYIGTHQNLLVKHPALIVSCHILQLLLSIANVCIFAHRTYAHEVSEEGHIVEVVLCAFFTLHYFIMRMQAGFSPASAWSPNALIDVLTVVPVLLPVMIGIPQVPAHVRWLSFSYLRSYRALTAYQHLERTVSLGEVSEFCRRVLLSVLRTGALVICMGCTVYILEVLGEIPGWEDQFIDTAMGSLSFIQICYWMFTTISTVGYGDFSPTTAPSRAFIVMCILGGVAFFGSELEDIMEVRSLLHHHKGRYVPRDPDVMHVVGIGPGVTSLSATMEAFLKEMLDAEEGASVPDVVLLSEEPFDEMLIRFVRAELPPKVRHHVHFLVGSAMIPRDLARARLKQCAMAFIIPNTEAPSFVEDGQNILRAIEAKRYWPKLQLRLMLLQPESKSRAWNVGIQQETCFSAFEQKITLLAQSTRVRGFLPLVIGLLQVMTPFHYKEAWKQVPEKDRGWMQEYLTSLRSTTHGFLVGATLVGLKFEQAASKVYTESSGRVLLIAVQEGGRLLLSFKGTLRKGQAVIAVASSREACSSFADMSEDWRVEFLSQREGRAAGSKSRDSDEEDEMIQVSSLQQFDASEEGSRSPPPRSSRRLKSANRRSMASFHRATSAHSNFGMEDGDEVMDRLVFLREVKETQEKEVKEFLSDPALVTLIVAGGSVWPQVVAFLRTLRQPYLPGHQPIIILSEGPPPVSVVEMFRSERTVFLVGPVLRVHNLVEAGVQKAQTVVILCGDQQQEVLSAAPSVLMDHNTVLLANTVERLVGGSTSRHFVINEFATTKALRLVQYVSSGISNIRPTSIERKTTLPQPSVAISHEDGTLRHQITRRWQRTKMPFWRVAKVCGNIFEDLFSNTDLAERDRQAGDDGGADAALSGNLIVQPRFAAGQAFTMDFFGSALGHVFHFPATIELLEALTMPARRGQHSFPWQVRCPAEWIGKPFGQLVKSWLLGEDTSLSNVGSATPIALYRRRGDEAVGRTGCAQAAGYNVTLPSQDTELRGSDLITVLASEVFGQAAAARGLLCGAGSGELGAPSAGHGHGRSADREASMLSIPESHPDDSEGVGRPGEFPDTKAEI